MANEMTVIAERMARFYHGDQRDKAGAPYVDHLRRVAEHHENETRRCIKGVQADAYARRCPSEKATFPTMEEAQRAAEAQMNRGSVRPGCHIKAYRCDECGRFHTANYFVKFRKERHGG